MTISDRQKPYPTFDKNDQAIFEIDDPQLKVDRLRELVLPKLDEIARYAFGLISDVYGVDALSTNTHSLSPAPRKTTKKTKQDYQRALAGLWARKYKDKLHYLNLYFVLQSDAFFPVLKTSRPVDAEALLGVLRDYEGEFLEMMDVFGLALTLQEQDAGHYESVEDVIRHLRVDHKQQWWGLSLEGAEIEYPVEDQDAIFRTIHEFVAMFCIYEATRERLDGQNDRFLEYFNALKDCFWSNQTDDETEQQDEGKDDSDDGLLSSFVPELSAIEGENIIAIRRHYRRESSGPSD